MLVCNDKSSAFVIGASILLRVKNAARLAVYEDTIISVNRYHMLAIHLVDDAFGAISLPVKRFNKVLNLFKVTLSDAKYISRDCRFINCEQIFIETN